jgi:hypothetical protein
MEPSSCPVCTGPIRPGETQCSNGHDRATVESVSKLIARAVVTPPPEELEVVFGQKRDQRESDGDAIITRAYDHDWITKRLAIGSAPYMPADVRSIQRAGITHVLSCENNDSERLYVGTTIRYLHCPTDDDGGRKEADWFLRGVRFAVDALASARSTKLLVHCAAGVNRSTGMAYAILRARGCPAGKTDLLITEGRRIARRTYFKDAERFITEVWR